MTARAWLVPPRRVTPRPGRFDWPERPVLASVRTGDAAPLGELARLLARETGARPSRAVGALDPAAVRVRRDRRVRHPEGYRLRVDANGVEIASTTAAGAFYGIQTLREMVRIHGRSLPAVDVRDEPDFARRGVYLDCSRGKVPTLATLLELVDLLASFKVNELQLYVENVFTFRRHPAIGRGFSPFSPADLLAVQDRCRERHVRFVPSLASFGHMERILSLPDYAALGEKPGHFGLPGGTMLCPGDPGSIRLIGELYEEFLPLFTAEDFNACGDETWELGQGRSRRRVSNRGVGAVYLEFLTKIHRLCQRHGKRMNVWADILLNHPETLGGLPDDVVLLNWDYGPDGARIPRTREIRESGRAFLVCPGTSGWQSHGTRLENAIANVSRFAQEGRRQGAEGLLNTDWGDYGHRNPLGVSLHGYAHGAAHSWNGRAVDDATFSETFAFHALGQDDDRLAAAVRTIGRADETAGASLYHAFSEGLDPRRDAFRGIPRISPVRVHREYRRRTMETASADGCRRVIEESPSVATDLGRGRGAFVRGAIEDIALAASLNRISARWILAGRAARAGTDLPVRELRRLGADIRRVTASFERSWMRGNRPSRLRDNLRLFESAAAECDGRRAR